MSRDEFAGLFIARILMTYDDALVILKDWAYGWLLGILF
jgi:hypothetical protein